MKHYLKVLFIALSLLFVVSLFKNISYPLFWADESMTVMHGKRVLEYGYPKVHDGKNVLYDLRHPNPTLGVDERTDAFIGGANWGQYYIAAVGVKMAEMSDDLYTKTGIIRSLFALIGFAGLAIFAWLTSRFFRRGLSRTVFLALFAFLELISVPLVLHLREARYYPLTVFGVAFAVCVYTRYRLLNKTGYLSFLVLLIVSLLLVFILFSPAFFILAAAIFLFESIMFAKRLLFQHQGTRGEAMPSPSTLKELFRDYVMGTLPLFLSLITLYPLMIFFKVSSIAEEMARFNTLSSNMDSLHMYLDNLSIIWRYFASFDLLYLALLLKVGLLCYCALKLADKSLPPCDVPKMTISNFLAILFIVYFFAIAKIPNFLFMRYYIPLQPVLALIIILDVAVLYNIFSRYHLPLIYRNGLVALFIGLMISNISNNLEFIKGHVYELSHPYKGPLDYVIPFIREKYTNTDGLVIATNYEETSFMYYLDSKVIVGFVGNNLEEDSRAVPDIIVYRKPWGQFGELFSTFIGKGQYSRISFPSVDFPTNNISELNWSPPFIHRFRTPATDDERARVDIFLRM